jgi:Mn2+/Fe2+ NRAMP family transporter
VDVIVALLLALFVNASILIVSAASFYSPASTLVAIVVARRSTRLKMDAQVEMGRPTTPATDILTMLAMLMLKMTLAAGGPNGVAPSVEEAYHLLSGTLGAKGASVLFGVALLASGQNSTLTGTIAGQVAIPRLS